MNAVAGLDPLLDRGLVADIFRMERSFALLESIGTNAGRLNEAGTDNFGELFGTFQTALTSECVLSAARLFDRPSSRFPTRCVRYVLDYLRDHARDLPPIREPHQLGLTLNAAGLGYLIEEMNAGSEQFARAVVAHFEQVLEGPETVDTLAALKTLRDKVIAHNEHVEAVAGPTWAALRRLVAHTKVLVGIIGWAWVGTAYDLSGDFILTSDAIRPKYAFERLLERLYPPAAT